MVSSSVCWFCSASTVARLQFSRSVRTHQRHAQSTQRERNEPMSLRRISLRSRDHLTHQLKPYIKRVAYNKSTTTVCSFMSSALQVYLATHIRLQICGNKTGDNIAVCDSTPASFPRRWTVRCRLVIRTVGVCQVRLGRLSGELDLGHCASRERH